MRARTFLMPTHIYRNFSYLFLLKYCGYRELKMGKQLTVIKILPYIQLKEWKKTFLRKMNDIC